MIQARFAQGATLERKTEGSGLSRSFLKNLGHKKRRQMWPLSVYGLIAFDDRKNIEPMAERFVLEHFR